MGREREESTGEEKERIVRGEDRNVNERERKASTREGKRRKAKYREGK